MLGAGFQGPFVLRMHTAPESHRIPALAVSVESQYSGLERLGVRSLRYQSGHSVAQCVGRPGEPMADRRGATGKRLDEDLAQRLLSARGRNDVGGGVNKRYSLG